MNAVIIDFDGTIADSFELVLEFLLTQGKRTLESVTPDERQRLKGLSMLDLALAVGVPRWKLPLTYFRGKSRLTKHMHKTLPFPGMEAVLSALYEEKYQVYILSSNSRRNISRFLTEHGLGGYFVGVYGNAGWFGKARALKKLLREHDLAPSATIYVGDEVRDIAAAKLAGMPSVAVAWGFGSEEQLLACSPTILVRKPAELQKSLVEWGRAA